MSIRKMASQHNFAMAPNSQIPRSTYMLEQRRKSTFNGGDLVPIYCEEMLPGDHFNGSAQLFGRMATPITPVLDNAELETFFFFVPNRILWEHWEEFMAGEDYTIPQVTMGATLRQPLSIADYFGIPILNQLIDGYFVNALPFRAYNKIFNDWFRDQNLVTELTENVDDGPDTETDYAIQKRAKKHDYFTSCLPWPQKGNAVSLPLGTTADVLPPSPGIWAASFADPGDGTDRTIRTTAGSTALTLSANATANGNLSWDSSDTNLLADLTTATAATINALREAIQVQRYLERQARGGSRYVEILLAQFGVRSPDYRLQRPEYIGGGKQTINSAPIAQTSSSDATTPQGNLAAFTTTQGRHNFSYAATEHGYVIGLVNVRCDLTYQQGLRKHWSRQTNLDYYTPVFAHLGEQPVTVGEIYKTGQSANDDLVFGYQERWGEYRYTPNELTGLFRSTATSTIDVWHYAEEFTSAPALNATFIRDPSAATLARSMAVGAEAAGQQVLLDQLYMVKATRPMPTYSVPGLMDHF